jgi:hypothetical protein
MGRALLHRWLLFWTEPRHFTEAFGPNSWFGGRDWLHKCRTGGTTSQHFFLPGASNIFARPYPGSCWHPSKLLMVHHVVQSAHRSLCSEGELSGIFLIIRRWIPSGALVCCSSQWGISIGPSSFCTWGCGRRCLSMVVQLFHSESSLIPAGCSYSRNCSYLLDFCPHLDFLAVCTLLSAWSGWEWALALLCFQPWPCLEVKLYSCKHWIHRAVCSSGFLKLIS